MTAPKDADLRTPGGSSEVSETPLSPSPPMSAAGGAASNQPCETCGVVWCALYALLNKTTLRRWREAHGVST